MEVSGASSASVQATTSVAVEVHTKTQDIQAQTAATLIQSVTDPDSALGQTIDVNA